jgi:hypothetical protein
MKPPQQEQPPQQHQPQVPIMLECNFDSALECKVRQDDNCIVYDRILKDSMGETL